MNPNNHISYDSAYSYDPCTWSLHTQGAPQFTFEKETFSMSEAVSYVEYTPDIATSAQREAS